MKWFRFPGNRPGRAKLTPGLIIGLPRAMMFYHFSPLWRTFWEELGFPLLVSPATNAAILEQGKSLTRSDLCLPIKTLLGHILWLKDKAGALFMPRLISIEEGAYLCPKILGINDVLRNLIPDLPLLIEPMVNYKGPRRFTLKDSYLSLAREYDLDPTAVETAYEKALSLWQRHQADLPSCRGIPPALVPPDLVSFPSPGHDDPPRFRLGIIGRPYVLFDPILSHQLLKKLAGRRVEIFCYQAFSPRELQVLADRLPKKIYWSLGKDLVAASLVLGERPWIDGVINVSSFACGQDAFTSYLIEHYHQAPGSKPFLSLVLDEHSSEVGLNTRLEAFFDVLETQSRSGNA
jgi:predicted nucleotide-binding protein (sugar kinase/HSP70/actin superfamily)